MGVRVGRGDVAADNWRSLRRIVFEAVSVNGRRFPRKLHVQHIRYVSVLDDRRADESILFAVDRFEQPVQSRSRALSIDVARVADLQRVGQLRGPTGLVRVRRHVAAVAAHGHSK